MSLTTRARHLASIGARNLNRNRARTALALGAISFGVFLSLLLASFANGLSVMMTNDVVFAKVGAIQVHRTGYRKLQSGDPLANLPNGGSLVATIDRIPGVVAVAGRLGFDGLASNGQDTTFILGRGIDPIAEYKVVPWSREQIDGSPISPGDSYKGVFGADLARALQVDTGDSVALQSVTQSGQQNAMDVEVLGTLDNATAFESKRMVHVALPFAQELVNAPDSLSELIVRVDDLASVASVATKIRDVVGPDFEVETWDQVQSGAADVIALIRTVIGIVTLVFLAIVVFGVVNTIAMSVMERTREIGTMMALGMKRGQIAALLFLEAGWLAVFGATLGTLCALGALYLLHGGIPLAAVGQTVARYRLIPTLPMSVGVTTIVAAVMGTIVASIVPVYRATRLRPVEALRVT